MMQHNWRNSIPSNSPQFLVKGTELNTSIPSGYRSRWQICEIRTFDGADHDREYYVRDASTVRDSEVAQGVRSQIVGRFATLDEAEQYIERQSK